MPGERRIVCSDRGVLCDSEVLLERAVASHWQDRSGAEVDIVIEAADGRVTAIGVKTGQTAKPEWFRWLAQMRDALGDKFTAGIALYAGNETLPFGDRLLATPISALWQP